MTEAQKEVRRERSRQWVAAHPEKNRAWKDAHPKATKASARAKDARYRAKHQDDAMFKAKRAGHAQRHAQTRRRLVRAVALHYGCQGPGCPCTSHQFMPEDVDFHHISDDKHFSLGYVTRSKARLAAEINKCVVLCAICHRRLHAGRFSAEGLRRCHVDEELRPV